MMTDHANYQYLTYPLEWGASRFHLGQLVRYRGELAYISGLNYLCKETYFCQVEGQEPGWYAEITFITSTDAGDYEICDHSDRRLETITDDELAPLLGSQVIELPGFVRNSAQVSHHAA
jgi:hypothetical protein